MKNLPKYVYLVYCNPEKPLVYAVYSRLKPAISYVKDLIKWRFERAKERGYEYGYYHLEETPEMIPKPYQDCRERTMFSACLKLKDGLKYCSDDGCYVQVKRMIVQSKYPKQ